MAQFVDLVADKKFLTGSSALALALGMGTAPAHAVLIKTQFTASQTQDLNNGETVFFGPFWDPNGFSADLSEVEVPPTEISPGFTETNFNLNGLESNTVAVVNGCSEPPGSSCKLRTYDPGTQVDGLANFQAAGDFPTFKPDGNYYFGLNDQGPPDPFGWMEITLTGGDVTLDQFAFEGSGGPALIPAPEPATLSLFAIGGAAVLAYRRRKRKQAI